jgi:uncharacterized alpha/beta hydrolase family protein
MNKKIVLLVIATISCLQVCWSEQEFSAFEKFAQRYAPPPEIIALLEKYKEVILQIKDRGTIKEIPTLFIKASDKDYGSSRLIHRFINAERLRRFIKKKSLNTLEVVKKNVYRLAGMWLLHGDKAVRLDGK